MAQTQRKPRFTLLSRKRATRRRAPGPQGTVVHIELDSHHPAVPRRKANYHRDLVELPFRRGRGDTKNAYSFAGSPRVPWR